MVEVPAQRLRRWVTGFAERHGSPDEQIAPDTVTLVAPDGAVAIVQRPFCDRPERPAEPGPPPLDESVDWRAAFEDRAGLGRDAAIVLVRRGGYAVGLLADGALVAHKAGTRYVQSRTAAGGWSQQRYARRRDGQAKALVGTVQDLLPRIATGGARSLVVGGDRGLVADVLLDPRAASLNRLPLMGVWDIPDPRAAVLDTVAERAGKVRIKLNRVA